MSEEKTKEKQKEKEKDKPKEATQAPQKEAKNKGPQEKVAASPDAAEEKSGDKGVIKKKKTKKNVPVGIVKIQSTFNNTIISISDNIGNVIAWSSSGSVGFKGSRKSTPFAAQLAANEAAKKALDCGMNTVSVFVNGPGGGRESAIRALQSAGLKISFIKDLTPVPHNGCRPKKRRRI